MQSRKWSAIETIASTAIGLGVSIAASLVVYPLHGHSFTLAQNTSIAVIFTVISIIRGYFVRRMFNRLGAKNP